MKYTVNIQDIELALQALGGESRAKDIQDFVLQHHCAGSIPDNYQHEKSFRQTIQRKIEDYCPQAAGFDESKREGKFLRVGHGLYRLAAGHNGTDFSAAEEVLDTNCLVEGATKTIAVNYYERNAKARSKCIEHHGCKCFVCEFDFEKQYGELGKSFVHVHHIVPLSEIKASYVVDPVADMRPVCANCHAIIHRTKIALSIDELKKAIAEQALLCPIEGSWVRP